MSGISRCHVFRVFAGLAKLFQSKQYCMSLPRSCKKTVFKSQSFRGLHRERSTFGLKSVQENKSLPVSWPLSKRIGKALSETGCVGGQGRGEAIFICQGSYLKVILLPIIFLFTLSQTLVLGG